MNIKNLVIFSFIHNMSEGHEAFSSMTEQEYLNLRCIILIYIDEEVCRLKSFGINLHDQVTEDLKSDVISRITYRVNTEQGRWFNRKFKGIIILMFFLIF